MIVFKIIMTDNIMISVTFQFALISSSRRKKYPQLGKLLSTEDGHIFPTSALKLKQPLLHVIAFYPKNSRIFLIDFH